MNPDLAMDTADQKLLKSTGAGNLFMVFGEPDLELRKRESKILIAQSLEATGKFYSVETPTLQMYRQSGNADIQGDPAGRRSSPTSPPPGRPIAEALSQLA